MKSYLPTKRASQLTPNKTKMPQEQFVIDTTMYRLRKLCNVTICKYTVRCNVAYQINRLQEEIERLSWDIKKVI